MNVAKDTVVTIEYAARLEDGALIDSTEHCGPVSYLHGNEQIFPALEAAVEGLAPGAERELLLSAEEAYGSWRAELVRRIPRDQLPPDLAIEIGARYQLKARDGKSLDFKVVEIVDEEVVADFNAKAAGQTLTISARVLAVRGATDEEIRRGTLR